MFDYIANLRQRLSEDRAAARVVRLGLLLIGWLLMMLVIFYSLDRWHTIHMPDGESTATLQKGIYALFASGLIAGLVTTLIAACCPPKDAISKEWAWWQAPVTAGLLALGIFITGYAFIGVFPFGGRSILMVDMHHQYAPLLSELRHMLLEGGDASYNFHIGMGSSFLPAFAYYLASPLNLLLVFFKESWLTEAILVITLIKFALAAAFFTLLAQYLTGGRDKWNVTVGIMYALSGYMLAYSWNIMWLDAVALLPLVVMSAEKMLKGGKVMPYALLLGLLLFSNYYIGFMVCIFLVLYWFVWAFRSRRTLKDVMMGGLRFGAGSLWGAGLAAVLLVPVALALGRTSAAGGELGAFRTNFEIFDLFGRLFYGATPTIRSGNLPNLYCGVVVVLLLPIYFSQKQISLRRRLCYGGLLAVMLLSCTITRWDLVWHGLHSPNDLPYRFSFLVVFVTLVLVAYALSHIKQVTIRQIFGSLMASAVYLVLWEKLAALNTSDKADRVSPDSKLLYINLLLLGIYAVVLLVGAVRKAPRRVAGGLLLAVVCTEMIFGTARTLTTMNENEHYTSRANYIDNMKHQVINDALRRVEELAADEDIFLRMEYLPRTSCVDTALHHYNGLTTFASSNPYCTTLMMGELGYAINGVNSYLYHSFVAPPDSLLGLQYVILETYMSNHPQLEYVETVTGTDEDDEEISYYIYRNKTALSVGVSATNALRDYEGKEYDPFGSQQELYTALSGLEDKLYEPMILYTESTGATVHDSSFYTPGGAASEYTATVETAGQYFAFVDCRAADDIYVNTYDAEGNSDNSWTVQNHEPYIIDMGTMQVGETVTVSVSNDGSATGNIYLMRLDTAAFARHLEVLQAGSMVVTEQTGHSIKGTVTAADHGTMFFSLPYDEGWTVKVNGREVKTFPVDRGEERMEYDDGSSEYVKTEDGAMLGIPLPEGTHMVELTYKTPGGKIGLLITLGSVLLMLIPLVMWLVLYFRVKRDWRRAAAK